MKTRNWRTALLALLALASTASAEDAADVLLKQVYAGGGKTLYCGVEFKPGERGIEADSIYDSKSLLRQFGCITSRQCGRKPDYAAVANDLHGLYPIQRSVVVDRRGSQFGNVPAGAGENDCGYQTSFQTFSPPDQAKGNVARAMIYMHRQHRLPLLGTLQMYQQWNQLDPPDEEERKRNSAIARIQGNSNPYIDKPALMDDLGTLPGR